MRLGQPYKDRTEEWAENGYRRLAPDALALDHPISVFASYYDTLLRGGRYPLWDAFDIDQLPIEVTANLALASPVYRSEHAPVPQFFVYSMDGPAVRDLIGRSMVGLPVGYVMRHRSRNSLLSEIEDATAGADPVLSSSFLDIEGTSDFGFDRGVFLFEDGAGRIAKLVLILVKNERVKGQLARQPFLRFVLPLNSPRAMTAANDTAPSASVETDTDIATDPDRADDHASACGQQRWDMDTCPMPGARNAAP